MTTSTDPAAAPDEETRRPVSASAQWHSAAERAPGALELLLTHRGYVPQLLPDPAVALRAIAELAEGAEAVRVHAEQPYALYTPEQITAFAQGAILAAQHLQAALATAITHLSALRERGDLGAANPDLPATCPPADPGGHLLQPGGAFANLVLARSYGGYRDTGAPGQLTATVAELEYRGIHVRRVYRGANEYPALEYTYRGGVYGLRFDEWGNGWETMLPTGAASGAWRVIPMAPGYTSAVHPRALAAAALRAVDEHLNAPSDPDKDREGTGIALFLRSAGARVLEVRCGRYTGDPRTEAAPRILLQVDGRALTLEAAPGWRARYRDAAGIERICPLVTAADREADPSALAAAILAIAAGLPEGWSASAAGEDDAEHDDHPTGAPL